MQLADFDFDLPDELIARFPAAQRSGSRLMVLDGQNGQITHRQFPDLLDYLRPGDLMVFNDTRVIPARLYGRKETGGKLEVLIERIVSPQQALAHVRASKSPRPGSRLILEEVLEVTVSGRQGDLFELHFDYPEGVLAALEKYGHMPLPPYIDRADEQADKLRYQTVYGCKPGAVAAPTAGLHFTDELLARIDAKGVKRAFVTLHVGAGTFQPVRVDNIREHKMHAEYIDVSDEVVAQIRHTKEAGGRVIAVGTTSVRSLESVARIARQQNKPLGGYRGDTDIFIYPGYKFALVDMMITNFHLPQSTLLMLVSAFAGRKQVLAAYEEAVRQRYRFFSYGDAMLLMPQR